MVKVKVVKVLGPFEVRPEPEAEPVKVWTVQFTYGATTETGSWQREGSVDVLDPLTEKKVKGAIKTLLVAAKPHPLDRTEFEV